GALRVTFRHADPLHSRLLPHGRLHLALSLFTATVSCMTIVHPAPPLHPRRPPRTPPPVPTPARRSSRRGLRWHRRANRRAALPAPGRGRDTEWAATHRPRAAGSRTPPAPRR